MCYNNHMHELPITQKIVKIADEHCRENGGSRVLKVNMVIGDYSGYVGEAIRTYFGIIAEGTLCEGASFEFRTVEPQLRCEKSKNSCSVSNVLTAAARAARPKSARNSTSIRSRSNNVSKGRFF